MLNALDPAVEWQALIRERADLSLCGGLAERMRERRLTFGGRLLCPFLRPFFLNPGDEARVRHAAETLWQLGERVAKAAAADPRMLEYLGLSEDEIRLTQIDPGYDVASTSARADAFILPDSLRFAEYNAESPAGLGAQIARIHCEVAIMLATRLGQGSSVCDALGQAFERWDGLGFPERRAGTDIPLPVRLAVVARDLEVLTRTRSIDEVRDPFRRFRDRT